jgi:hypothetical protein
MSIKNKTKLRLDAKETAFRVMLEATKQKAKTALPSDREDDQKNPEAVRRGAEGGRPSEDEERLGLVGEVRTEL